MHRTKPARVSSSLIELRPALAAQTTNRRSHRCLTTGRLGNSHADGARARNPIRTALFAFVTTDRIPMALEHRNSAANKRRRPSFTDEKEQPSAPPLSGFLLADPPSDPRAQAPTRGARLACLLRPRTRPMELQAAHAGVVSKPTCAAWQKHARKGPFCPKKGALSQPAPGAPSPPLPLSLISPSPPLFLFFSSDDGGGSPPILAVGDPR